MKISTVVTLCNRWEAFEKMADSLHEVMEEGDELIVADFMSDDLPDGRGTKESLNVKEAWPKLIFRLIQYPRPFREAYGLNEGARLATGDILLFALAELSYPKGLREQIIDCTEGEKCFFPCIEQEKQPGGGRRWWDTSYGVCAFSREVWDGYPFRWREDLDGHWGAGDTYLFRAADQSPIQVCRPKVPGLLHHWHPETKAFREKYYGLNRDDPVQQV